MNRHQERMFEDWLDGPRARYHRRQRAIERRELLADLVACVIGLTLLFVTFAFLAP